MESTKGNMEINEVLIILEEMEDEQLAAKLLQEFNNATKVHGQLILNKDPLLLNEDWKKKCDLAQEQVKKIINKIKDQK